MSDHLNTSLCAAHGCIAEAMPGDTLCALDRRIESLTRGGMSCPSPCPNGHTHRFAFVRVLGSYAYFRCVVDGCHVTTCHHADLGATWDAQAQAVAHPYAGPLGVPA